MIGTLLNNSVSKTITIYTRSETVTAGVVGEPTFVLYKSLKGLYWKATGSKPNVADKYKEQVIACVVVDPKVLSESELTTDCKITVSGEGDYMLVYPDDIAGQGKVLLLNLKEWA